MTPELRPPPHRPDPPAHFDIAMERIYLNQTALSLGYIALKRIRALEAPATRLPSNPLLRHLCHVKVLAACVEQVGPDEIIEYEINQDFTTGEEPESQYEMDAGLDGWLSKRKGAVADISERRNRLHSPSSRKSREPLPTINEVTEYQDNRVADGPRKALSVTNLASGDFDDDGEYSMDELYDEYNSLEDEWETASDLSDDDSEDMSHSASRHLKSSPCIFKDEETDSDTDSEVEEEEEDTHTPPNVLISRSPPLDITMRHPITHELSKREQYRRQVDEASNELSKAFVEQIEDVLCHEIRFLSIRGVPGKLRLETVRQQPVSLCA